MINITNFSFGYNNNSRLYDNLCLELKKGHIYGLFGKNGTGKSTLLKAISGLVFPQNGNINVNGKIPQHRKPTFYEDLFFLFEDLELPNMPLDRYLATYSCFYPKFDKTYFYQLLQEFDINFEVKTLRKMSLGQQKKVQIAFGLATNTSVLLMDEPTNGLDIPSKKKFRQLMAAAITEEKLFIISTHQVRDLENLIDYILILQDRKIDFHASIAEISQKLTFTHSNKNDTNHTVLYSENSLAGKVSIMPNLSQDESKVDLELLFNAIQTNPVPITDLFA